jgi:hypothetical protein
VPLGVGGGREVRADWARPVGAGWRPAVSRREAFRKNWAKWLVCRGPLGYTRASAKWAKNCPYVASWLGPTRSRQDEPNEVREVGSKRTSSGGNGGHVLSLYPLVWRSLHAKARPSIEGVQWAAQDENHLEWFTAVAVQPSAFRAQARQEGRPQEGELALLRGVFRWIPGLFVGRLPVRLGTSERAEIYRARRPLNFRHCLEGRFFDPMHHLEAQAPGQCHVPLATGGYWTTERSALLGLQFGKKGKSVRAPPLAPVHPGVCEKCHQINTRTNPPLLIPNNSAPRRCWGPGGGARSPCGLGAPRRGGLASSRVP